MEGFHGLIGRIYIAADGGRVVGLERMLVD